MFIGHFAFAVAPRRATHRTSLGWLFAACRLPDLIRLVLPLAGVVLGSHYLDVRAAMHRATA
jgi:hypothetical protein